MAALCRPTEKRELSSHRKIGQKAAEAGVIQLTNAPAHKGQFGGADDNAGNAEQQTSLPRQQPRRFTQHQDNKQRR
ncbi:hypothetical protein HMPREF9543_04487 [Escherichia coli MS 146-1]|nr:hypothetical protein HMPREF9543_04487 [Escherichia coli MS 146-1]